MRIIKNILTGLVLVLASPIIMLYVIGKDFLKKRERGNTD